MHELGVIHGRFQILHNDHLTYLLAGKKRCRHLLVGVTNPDPILSGNETTDPARSDPLNNPCTYYERSRMVRAALVRAGIPLTDFSVTPLPISRPDLLIHYAPKDAVYYLTIYDDWGREKKARLERLGLTTCILWEKASHEKGISGRAIRQAIRQGNAWKDKVPPPVAELVEQLGIARRLGQDH